MARNEILGCHIYIIVGCIMFLLSLFFIFIYFAAPDLSSGTWDFLVVASEIFLNSFACKFLVVAHEIYFPDQGLNLGPLHWEGGVLATGPLDPPLVCPLDFQCQVFFPPNSESFDN